MQKITPIGEGVYSKVTVDVLRGIAVKEYKALDAAAIREIAVMKAVAHRHVLGALQIDMTADNRWRIYMKSFDCNLGQALALDLGAHDRLQVIADLTNN